jgi:hypothetical protein
MIWYAMDRIMRLGVKTQLPLFADGHGSDSTQVYSEPTMAQTPVQFLPFIVRVDDIYLHSLLLRIPVYLSALSHFYAHLIEQRDV